MTGEERAAAGGVRTNTVIRWRVLAGAALMTLAAGGVVFAHRAAQQPPTTRYLVVTEEVSAGSRVAAADLGSVAIELPDAVAALGEQDADEVVGRVANRNLSPSTLISAHDVLQEGLFEDPDEQQVTVALDPSRFRASAVAPGRMVHVMSTVDGDTTHIASARITSIGDDQDGGIGSASSVQVSLAVDGEVTAAAVVNANVVGTVTLVVPSPAAREDS
jgi:hypothetical protein